MQNLKLTAKIFNIQKFSLHDGQGIRTSVFFSGCNLRCKWCANPECFLPDRKDTLIYSIDELLLHVIKDKVFYDKSGGGVTLTGGEIFMQYDFILEFISELKKLNINIVIETAGATDLQKFEKIVNSVDFVYIDCKHYDEKKHIDGTGICNKLILSNIARLAELKSTYCVRIPIIPDYNDSLDDAQQFSRLLNSLNAENVELLPFHQFGESKYDKLELEYAFKGVPQLYKTNLTEISQVFKANNINVII